MSEAPEGARRPEVSVEDLAGLGSETCVIDVRTRPEYVEGHVPGAQLLPLHVLVGDETEVLSAGAVYVICGSGTRSAMAVDHLRGLGIAAIAVRGGTRAWIAAGFTLERDEGGLS